MIMLEFFYFGGLGQFDDLCYQTISELKIKYPHIRRIFCVSDPRWVRWDKRPQWLKNEVYEEVVYLDLKYDYWYTRIYYRNCEIINQSDIVVFYVKTKEKSGAYKALYYAKSKKKKFVNICEINE